jgi:Protein of unknown function (DUF2370)
VHTHEF